MNLRPLVVTSSVMEQVEAVKRYAERNIYTVADMAKAIACGLTVGDDEGFRLIIPVGYRIVYSQEEQTFVPNGKPPEIRVCHHISVSVDGDGNYPNELAVEEICKLFGADFSKRLLGYLEEESESVNVIIPV